MMNSDILTPSQELILPPGVEIPRVQPREEPAAEETPEQKAKYMPEPTGYKLLCALPEVGNTYEGSSILRPESFAKQDEIATTVLWVVKVGPEAYKDEKKFPSGPWCKAGDFILVRTYAGTRFKIFGREWRLLNDDQVEAVVEDPRGITRIGV